MNTTSARNQISSQKASRSVKRKIDFEHLNNDSCSKVARGGSTLLLTSASENKRIGATTGISRNLGAVRTRWKPGRHKKQLGARAETEEEIMKKQPSMTPSDRIRLQQLASADANPGTNLYLPRKGVIRFVGQPAKLRLTRSPLS